MILGAVKLIRDLAYLPPIPPAVTYRTLTLIEVQEFLREDDTDKFSYIPWIRTCDWFAKRLMRNARKKGIPMLYVVLENDICHAINAVRTKDAGLIFIEPQHDTIMTLDEIY